MKSKTYKSIVTKIFLLSLGWLVLTLAITNDTQARPFGTAPGKQTLAQGVLTGRRSARLKTSAEFKAGVLSAIARARLSPANAKSPSKACGCTSAPSDVAGGFWSCLRGCLADAGVSYVHVIGCAASCAFIETGVGTILCAICVGVSVTVVEFCALGCAMVEGGKGFGEIMDARNHKHRKTVGTPLQAKLRTQPARSGS